MSLPAPQPDQAYWTVSALEGGEVDIPAAALVHNSPEGQLVKLPVLAFLLHHSKTGDSFVFDLGIRSDFATGLPPAQVKSINSGVYFVKVPKSSIESLRAGGKEPADVEYVCPSHVHFDHIGDPAPFVNATFIVGARSKEMFTPGYPADPNSFFSSKELPEERTRFVETDGWAPLGPIARAHDYFGDGSLYLIDAPGHCPGHLNALVRTSADGAWVYLAGDSAHDWRLIHGLATIADGPLGCTHMDKAAAETHIGTIHKLAQIPRVRILLAHDVPWYAENEGGSAFWPGKVESL